MQSLREAIEHTPRDLDNAFAGFSEERYQRTAWCQIMARIYSGFYLAEHVTRELAD